MQAFAADEAAAEAQLRCGKTAGFTSGGFVHAGDFKQHVSWKDHCNPEFRSTFTLTHSDFRWTLGDGLVWENAAEDFSFTLEEAGDGHTAGFDVDVFDPAAVKGLETEVTKVQFVAAGGVAAAVAALRFAIFYSAWKKGHTSRSGGKGLVRKKGQIKPGLLERGLELGHHSHHHHLDGHGHHREGQERLDGDLHGHLCAGDGRRKDERRLQEHCRGSSST